MAISIKTPSKTQARKIFSQLIDSGRELILLQKITVAQNGKRTGKAPVGKNWTTTKPLTLDQAVAKRLDGHNIGYRIGKEELVIDIDPKNAEGADQFALLSDNIEGLDNVLSLAPHVLTGSRTAGEPGRHYYTTYDLPDGWKEGDRFRAALPGFPGIEFKTRGTQVVVPLSQHPDSEELYEWSQKPNFPAPKLPSHLVEKLWVRKGAKPQGVEGEPDYSAEQLAKILAQIDATLFRDHDKWFSFMAACNEVTLGIAADEFIDWSTSDDEYAHSNHGIAYRWDSLTPGQKGNSGLGNFLKACEEAGVDPTPDDEFASTATEDDEDEIAEHTENAPAYVNRLNQVYSCVARDKLLIHRRVWNEVLERWEHTYVPASEFKKLFPKNGGTLATQGQAVKWMEHQHRNFFDGITLRPDIEGNVLNPIDGRNLLNLWQGFGVEPSANGNCNLLYRLIREAIAQDDAEVEKYLLDWMAFAVQFPSKQAEVAIALVGGKGTGKGTIGRAFVKLFGQHGMQITNRSLLTGQFNGHLEDVVGLFADEALFTGDKAGVEMLKSLVTEDLIAINAKYQTPRVAKNMLHIMMASNSQEAVPATRDERRFAVFLMNDVFVGEFAFFEKLVKQLKNGGYGRLLHDLLTRDIKGFHPRKNVPQTTGLAEQKFTNATDPYEMAFVDGVINNTLLRGYMHGNGSFYLDKDEFRLLAKEAARKKGADNYRGCNQAASKFFKEFYARTGRKVGSVRPSAGKGENRPSFWMLPARSECIVAIADWYGFDSDTLIADTDKGEWLGM